MVLGPDIDPPARQHSYRTPGVYETEDTRVGFEGNTYFEVWGAGRPKPVATISVDPAFAWVTATRLWEFYDLFVEAPRPRRTASITPRHLRVL